MLPSNETVTVDCPKCGYVSQLSKNAAWLVRAKGFTFHCPGRKGGRTCGTDLTGKVKKAAE